MASTLTIGEAFDPAELSEEQFTRMLAGAESRIMADPSITPPEARRAAGLYRRMVLSVRMRRQSWPDACIETPDGFIMPWLDRLCGEKVGCRRRGGRP